MTAQPSPRWIANGAPSAWSLSAALPPERDPQLDRFVANVGNPRGALRARLLALLDEQPGHGFQLNERLKAYGLGGEDPSPVYRALHWLENAQLVRSSWDTPETGPARRVYELTERGVAALQLAFPVLAEAAVAPAPDEGARTDPADEELAAAGVEAERGAGADGPLSWLRRRRRGPQGPAVQ